MVSVVMLVLSLVAIYYSMPIILFGLKMRAAAEEIESRALSGRPCAATSTDSSAGSRDSSAS